MIRYALLFMLAWSLSFSAVRAQSSLVPRDGLALWLRADSAVTADAEGRVSHWADVSGRGNDALAAGTSAQPHVDGWAVNGRPALLFDGVDDFLAVADAPELRPERMTLFVVALMDGTPDQNGGGQGPFLLKVSDGNWNDGYGLARFDGGHKRDAEFFAGDYVNGKADLPLPFDAYALYTGVYDGDVVRLAVDGGPFAETPVGGAFPQSAAPLLLGTEPGDDGARTFLEGGIAEVILYDRALSEGERLLVEHYLAEKYGLEIRPVPTDGLALWLRADRGVVVPGGDDREVFQWGDYSGQNNDAADLIGLEHSRPTWEGVQGIPAVRFHGDDYLGVADTPGLNPEQMTLFVVGLADQSADRFSPFVIKTSDFAWEDGYGLAVTEAAGEGRADVDVGFFVNDWTSHLVERVVTPNRFSLFTGRFDQSAVQLHVDRTLAGALPFDEGLAGNSEPLYLGASSDGAGFEPRAFLEGALAEVLLYGRALPEAERAQVEQYLWAKYGLTGPSTANEDEPSGLPADYALTPAYPNPFNPQARFTLSVAQAQPVRVELFDALGRRVALLHDGVLSPGQAHTFTVDGRDLPSGLYLYRATGATFRATRSAVLMK